ncbi:hypothetical protein ZWY2020_048172 [Hordeum vulgare]|nr:hypothetical protein ZWY2020_048172 [Hordeum vulgare]
MSRLASELHRLRRSPWEVLCSALVSCDLVLFSQLAVCHIAPPLPIHLPPRHATRRRFGIPGGYSGGQVLEEVHQVAASAPCCVPDMACVQHLLQHQDE